MHLKVEAAAQILLGFAFCQTFGAHIPCREPSDAELESMLSHHLAPGVSLLAPMEDVLPDQDLKSCPVNVSQTSSRLQDRSASPWSYRVNEDPRRYPRRVLEAYCLCEGCLVDRQEDRSVQSEPFYQEVPVLQKSGRCEAGQYVYQPSHLQVAQFCICTFP
ncbi:interleukin-17D-like [Trachemys scripta elegans]|uniref:interleukin-17D-like n=1 Tax=Trachemys scripta elegans TaxID=31138 RepID=UPI001557AAA0|nr:interleukin-17D-like [Trachemys scripta elegans]XP_053901619.1 interleukin-17D-like [Malaclemys terrapin pileata]